MNIVVVANYDALSEQAAKYVAEHIHRSADMTVGLPTGNTPSGMYERLVQMGNDGVVDFSQMQTFNLDEYWGVESEHPVAFARYIHERFISRIDIAAERVHWPAGIGDAEQEAQRYERLIEQAGGLDLVILGIGGNGHIGFNEPGTSFESRTGLVPLAERTRVDALHAASGFTSAAEVPTHGISMGIATIMDARHVLLLASGAAKAEAIGLALEGAVTEAVPASVLQRHPRVTVIVDEAAASALAQQTA